MVSTLSQQYANLEGQQNKHLATSLTFSAQPSSSTEKTSQEPQDNKKATEILKDGQIHGHHKPSGLTTPLCMIDVNLVSETECSIADTESLVHSFPADTEQAEDRALRHETMESRDVPQGQGATCVMTSTNVHIVSPHEKGTKNRAPSDCADGRSQSGGDTTVSDQTESIFMTHMDKTMDGKHKKTKTSSLVMEEVEAMTLLLLTGVLPDEHNQGSTQGAGDAQHIDTAITTDRMEDAQDSDEAVGLATMLNNQSKSSCQLEQLQTEQNQPQVQNLHSTPSRNDQQSQLHDLAISNNSRAEGAQTYEENAVPSSTAVAEESDGCKTTNSSLGNLDSPQHSATDGAAASSWTEESVDDCLPSPQRPDSPGAASSEGDWDVIPLHRVLGEINLGALAAGATPVLVRPCDEGPQNTAVTSLPSLGCQVVPVSSFAVTESQASCNSSFKTMSGEEGRRSEEEGQWQLLNSFPPGEPEHLQLPMHTKDAHMTNADEVEQNDSLQTALVSVSEREGMGDSLALRRAPPPVPTQTPHVQTPDLSQNACSTSSENAHVSEQGHTFPEETAQTNGQSEMNGKTD